MKQSHSPVACGFHVCLMSPLGTYPDTSIILEDAALIVNVDLCFSIVRIKSEEWGYSEVDLLSHLQIPLLGSLLLARVGYPYPMQGFNLEAESQREINLECIDECRSHLLASLTEEGQYHKPSGMIHRPPVLGGIPYSFSNYDERVVKVRECIPQVEAAGPVVQRGVAALLKAHMAWEHGEFADAACIYLWIALDAAHSLTLQKLRESGTANPSSKDASAYFNGIIGYETPWEKFFEEDYRNRIRAIHPDNRFGSEAMPQFQADDFYELNHLLIPYFLFLVSGTYADPDAAD